MQPDPLKLPPDARIERHIWPAREAKREEDGWAYPQPAQPESVQYVVLLREWDRDAVAYLESLGHTTWGSGGLRWLGEVLPM